MKKVAFIGQPGATRSSYRYEFDRLFTNSGANTGNYAFWHAAMHHFQNEREYLPDWSFDPARIRAEFDVILLPASNFLHPDKDFGGRCDKLERCELPIVIIGLGAQASDAGSLPALTSGTVRFIKLLAERCHSIGVRGEFTARVLEAHGVTNVEILGCPANLINLKPDLGKQLEGAYRSLPSRLKTDGLLSIAVCTDLHRLAQYRQSRKLIQWKEQNAGIFICQNPDYLVRIARAPHPGDFNDKVTRLRETLFPRMSSAAFYRYALSNFITFFSVEPWMEYLRRFHLSVGTRFHGNMLAIQAGVPAFFVNHDARTSELTTATRVAAISLSELNEVDSVEGLLSKHGFDGIAYDRNRQQTAGKYARILERAGLLPSAQLTAFHGNE